METTIITETAAPVTIEHAATQQAPTIDTPVTEINVSGEALNLTPQSEGVLLDMAPTALAVEVDGADTPTV